MFSEARQAYAALPPQEMRIGTRTLLKVQFVSPVRTVQKFPDREENGILAAALFEPLFHNSHRQLHYSRPEMIEQFLA